MSIPVRSSGPWSARRGPKVDDRTSIPGADDDDLVGRYEALRHVALSEGPAGAGLAGPLLMGQGMGRVDAGLAGMRPGVTRGGMPAPSRRSAGRHRRARWSTCWQPWHLAAGEDQK